MATGLARLTPDTQHFLDRCPAVRQYIVTDDESYASFVYDETVDVPVVPPGVYFDVDRAPHDIRADADESWRRHEIVRTTRARAHDPRGLR